jgi:hypothetical protein
MIIQLETYESIKQKFEANKKSLSPALSTRLHRAISWLSAAEDASHDDMRFISLWISLSACFTISTNAQESLYDGERFKAFIFPLVKQDTHKKIYTLLWHEYSGPVKALIKNPYVFAPYWAAQRSEHVNRWKDEFNVCSVAALNALSRQQVPELLCIVLERLYVLREQLMQGGATFQGQVNREQVQDGVSLLNVLVPLMIEIMLFSEEQNWGDIAYPVANKTAETVN